MTNERIVFYDGVCVLCNRSVRLLIFLNRRADLRFSSLDSVTAKELLPPSLEQASQSVVYFRNGFIFTQSDAAIRALADAAWYLKIVMVLLICPRFMRDGIYAWVARNRYRIFGKYDACEIPSAKHRDRFMS